MLKGCMPFPKEIADNYVAKGYWKNVPLGDAFDRVAEVYYKKEALIFEDLRITYGQLKSGSDRLAMHLLNMGLRPLDRVVVQLPNIPEFVYCYLACLKIGVIPVMCLPPHRYSEISYIAKKCEARGYLIPDVFNKFNYLELAEEIKAEVPSLEFVLVAGRQCPDQYVLINDLLEDRIEERQSVGNLEEYRPDPMEVAVFLLSGGTTGLPKIIPRTHNDYLYTSEMTSKPLGFNMYTAFLVVAPLGHNMTLACPGVMGTYLNGGKVVLSASTRVDNICGLVEKERITNLPLVPALIIGLLNYEKRKGYDLSSLLTITSGGSKLNPEVAKRIKPELGCHLVQQFGMAEGLLTMTDMNDDDEARFNTIGYPVSPADQFKIVGPDGEEVSLETPGELWCRGPYTIRGYYDAPAHNEAAFTEDGFYKSGDIVRLHPSGRLIVEGRKKDLINRGGEKISPEEVENLILAHPKVENAAVVAMPDPVMGERSCAYVTLKQQDADLTLEELNLFLLEKRIAKFKFPERLEVISEFPLTNVGKIKKNVLRQDIERKTAEENRAKI
ncbi:MAG: hypothetical protein JL50_05190 [Peptococcaceae bacterium BICA1-7]|nr:MAG: hypothetical protein JL50_05190 [Peptococcaceae bacterium BICA1-7]HBV96010.1 (2,3-dihydroxybenzoyl)adenylate synthase [Desulfotomaculum sp.]